MEAPKGRYSVVEKDGRLIVIDNGTGEPIPSTFAPPSGGPGPGRSQSSAPISDSGPGPLDRAADVLLALAVKRWDSQGRAVIAWQWQENNKVKRWDAALDQGQQRRLGRALLALAAAPLLLLLAMIVDGGLFGLAIMLAVPPLLWAVFSLRRLHRETDDPSLRP